MKSSDISVVLRPRSVGAGVDLAALLLRAHWRRWAPLALAVAAVCFGFVLPAMWIAPESLGLPPSANPVENEIADWMVRRSLTAAGPGLLARVLQVPLVLLGGELLFGGATKTATLLRRSVREVGAMVHLGVAHLWVLGSALLCCGMVVPVAVLPVYFLPEVLLLERQRGLSAWQRAVSLGVGTAPWHAFAGSMAGAFLFVWWPVSVHMALRMILQDGLGLTGVGSTTVGLVLFAGAQALAYGVALAMCAAVRLALYVDARTREEHWDVDVALRGAAERA